MYTLSEFLGNDDLKNNFKKLIINDSVFHAFILSGNFGLGKKTFAKTMAKAILCNNFKEKNDACCKCQSCVSFDENNNPDILFIKQKDKKTIGIDELREQLLDTINIKPFMYSHKVYIIENAELLTIQAQNALLKTLEEPPEFVVIILVCDNLNALLPTVLSRCMVFRLKELKKEDVLNTLILKHNVSKEKADFLSDYARGSLGFAVKTAVSEEFNSMREEINSFLLSLNELDIASAVGYAKNFEKYKQNSEFLNLFYLWYKDVLTYLKFKDENLIIQKDIKNEIIKFSGNEDISSVLQKLDIIWDINKKLLQNVSFTLAIEYRIIKLKD